MALVYCPELDPLRKTILYREYQKVSLCGLGSCDPVLGPTSYSMKRARFAKGAHRFDLIAGGLGSITMNLGSETFGTTGIGDSGADTGQPWALTLTRSDTDMLKGGAFQQRWNFMILGIGVAPVGAVQISAGNVETSTVPISRQANDYDRVLTRMLFWKSHGSIQSPDSECQHRLDIMAEMPSPFGVRNEDVPINGNLTMAEDFNPFMAGYCAGASFRDQPTIVFSVDRTEIMANDASDPLVATVNLTGAETPQALLFDGDVFVRYAVFFYGFVVMMPALDVCGPVGP
jgi:hypothetical protein